MTSTSEDLLSELRSCLETSQNITPDHKIYEKELPPTPSMAMTQDVKHDSACYQPLEMTTEPFPELDSDQATIESRYGSSGQTFRGLPPTPPPTPPKEKGANGNILRMSRLFRAQTLSAQSKASSRIESLETEQAVPAMQSKRRQVSVFRMDKTSKGYVEISDSYDAGEKAQPDYFSMPTRTPSVESKQLEYIDAHMGDPCSWESLDHVLGCGHRVMTTEPEPCASNCHVKDTPDEAQLRDLDSSYACMACIVDHLKSAHVIRLDTFTTEIEAEAFRLSKDRAWVDWKIRLMATGWNDEDLNEMRRRCKGRKICCPIWIDPEWRHLCDIVSIERQEAANLVRKPTLSSLSSTPTSDRRPSILSRSDTGSSSKMSPTSPPYGRRNSRTPSLARSFTSFFSRRDTSRSSVSRSRASTRASTISDKESLMSVPSLVSSASDTISEDEEDSEVWVASPVSTLSSVFSGPETYAPEKTPKVVQKWFAGPDIHTPEKTPRVAQIAFTDVAWT